MALETGYGRGQEPMPHRMGDRVNSLGPVATEAGEASVSYQLQVLDNALDRAHSAADDLYARIRIVVDVGSDTPSLSPNKNPPARSASEAVERLRVSNARLEEIIRKLVLLTGSVQL